ncbi:MAG: DUF2807 domain-containing protein [Sphingomonadales bacterium]|nr:DUF2807 domain-containing protein [Sphingomonadales bacterium]
MIKKLLIVFASGLVLSVVLLSSAWVIGGPSMLQRIDKDGDFHVGWSDDDDGRTPMTTRTLAFDAAKPLEVAAPVELHYTKGDAVALSVRGPQKLIDAVLWENGRLSLKDHVWFHNHTLKIDITAPRMPDLVYKGAGNIELENLDQPTLALEMAGAGNIEARGQVQTLVLHARGAGNVDLSDLAVRDATVESAGVGNVDLNASGKVDATLSGAGNISLHRKPAELTSRVHGIGSIDEDY